jgi:hypothetical protein
MTSKSELKVGDLVCRRPDAFGFAQGSGMVIEILHWGAAAAAQVKWLDTNYGQSQWYLDQLQKVIKE